VILETWEGPHGLLTSRLLMDIHKYGGTEDPSAFVRLLVGDAGDAGDDEAIGATGSELAEVLAIEDTRAQTLAFAQWMDRFFDAFGAACWKAVHTGA
jgi:hypothetical protein